mmetsp:Transcript_30748/g.57607  ORF Transcript_30748/g.57607 Transcript_30748/m.57607 type:complete len:373 (+) Transcript_30748:34-1152(+)
MPCADEHVGMEGQPFAMICREERLADDHTRNPEQDVLLPNAPEQLTAESDPVNVKRIGVVMSMLVSVVLVAATVWMPSGSAVRGATNSEGDDGIEYGTPMEVGRVDDAISELYTASARSLAKRCILCNPNQCTLDYSGKGAWTSCPVHAPYFSEAHCKCVASGGCSDKSGTVPTCSLCKDCAKTACLVGGKYMRCAAQTPFYEPNKKLCASSCQPPPGPAPPPYQAPQIGTITAPAPAPSMYASPAPSLMNPVTPSPPLGPATSKCVADTGGSCGWMSCAASRGKTKCSNQKCLCANGYCADEGKCIKFSTFQRTQPCKHIDTGTSCRWSHCDAQIGHTKCDSLTAGKGTYKCLCKSHYCYDPATKKCVKQR